MENKLQISDPNAIFTNEGLKQALQVCQHFLASGSLPSSYRNAQQVLMAIQLGRELGMKPVESLNGMMIINGQIKLWGTALTGRLTREGYKIKWGEITPEKAEVSIVDPDGHETGKEVYTIEDAKTAGLLNKQNWKAHAKTMLRWRALSNCVKFNFPHILQGVQLVEDDDTLEKTQEQVQAEPTEVKQQDNASKIIDGSTEEETPKITEEELIKIQNLIEITDTKKEDVEKFYGKKIEELDADTTKEVIKMLEAKRKGKEKEKEEEKEPPLTRARRLAEEKKIAEEREANGGVVKVPEDIAQYLNSIQDKKDEDLPPDIVELRKDVNAGNWQGYYHYPTLKTIIKKL